MNVVGTVLLTSIPNPMCPGCDNYKPDPDLLRNWVRSLRGCGGIVVHDELTTDDNRSLAAVTSCALLHVRVDPTADNLFVQRWMHHQHWLRSSPSVEWVWLTDGTDVRMLNEPWEHMEPGVLYVGSENDTVSNRWILENHPSLRLFAKAHRNNRLLNAGLLGGDRETVLDFLDDFIPRAQTASAEDLTDMAAFNLTLYEGHRMFETGYPIHTKFNAWVESDPRAYFAHK